MTEKLSKPLVLTILRHAEDFPWRVQDIGLVSLRLDEHRECRLHVWNPVDEERDPPIHDHPYDFTSTIIAGELRNTRYEEDPSGDEYVRFRYSPGFEDLRRLDTVRLSATTATLTEGQEYRQLAPELHASAQLAGTVTVIRCSWVEAGDLTVCHRDEGSWRSGRARDATRDEIKKMAAKALEWF